MNPAKIPPSHWQKHDKAVSIVADCEMDQMISKSRLRKIESLRDKAYDHFGDLIAEIHQLREVLAFYACKSNYRNHDGNSNISDDGGEIARQALKIEK